MFIEACLLAAGLQAGTGLFKKIKNRLQKTKKQDETIKSEHQIVKKSLSGNNDAEKFEKEVNQCLSLSAASMGMATIGTFFSPVFSLLSVAVSIYICIPIFRDIRKAVFEERTIKRIAFIDGFACAAAILTGYYFGTALMLAAYFGAQKLRILTEKKSRESLVNIFGEQLHFIWILKDGIEVEIPFEQLQTGDIVVVNAGEQIPADGIIIRGSASVDQHILTGESQPVEKDIDDRVFAATLMISGRIYIRVEKAGQETVAAKICEILENTADFTADIEIIGQQIADESVIPALTLSLFALFILGPEGMVAVLFSDSLVNMRLVTPIGMLNFLGKASREGILIKDGRSLQLLPLIDTVVFDKTGTLTLEQLNVKKVHTFNNVEEDKVLIWAAAAEHRQKHPVAKAIIQEAEKRRLSIPDTHETLYKTGFGIKVKIKKKQIRVGSRRFMEIEGISISKKLDTIQKDCYEKGCSLVFIAADDRIIGAIELEQTIRPEIGEVIKRLKKINMELYIISGDHEMPTRTMAKQLGIKHYFAEVLPQDKASLIKKIQMKGRKVCFVGDGINDSIALKKADISVSMSGASTIATDSAQIILMDQTLEKLPEIFDMACNFQNNMRDTFLAVTLPMVVGISGIFTLGFKLPALIALYIASAAMGAGVTMLPAPKKNSEDSDSED